MTHILIDTTTASIIVSLAIFAATIVLVYVTYILGKHTLLLSKMQITPYFAEPSVGSERYPKVENGQRWLRESLCRGSSDSITGPSDSVNQ
jgi:hypothetical protein